jgi:hypothetical protein
MRKNTEILRKQRIRENIKAQKFINDSSGNGKRLRGATRAGIFPELLLERTESRFPLVLTEQRMVDS